MNRTPKLSVLITLLLYINLIQAQTPNDCSDAIQICGNSSVDLDVSGTGNIDTFSNACGMVENNTIWFRLTFEQGGTLGFVLTPNSSAITEDYDFSVFGPTNSCANLGQAIRCSTTNPAAANQGNNLTGMSDPETDVSEGPGADGNSFVSWITVQAGETYYLLIDRPIGNSPFSLEWTGTAQFPESPEPQVPNDDAALSFDRCDNLAPFDDGVASFNLEENTPIILGGQTNTVVTYHTTEEDAILGNNPIASPYMNTNSNEIIYSRIENTVSGCFVTTQFNLNVRSINANAPSDLIICDNDNDGDITNGIAEFDLEETISEVLSGQDPDNFTVTFHTTENDAENDTNPIATMFENTMPDTQQVFIRIEEIANDCIGVFPLNLTVNPIPEANDTTLIQCDEDGIPEGFTIFDLNQAFDDITGGVPDRTINFYVSLSDLENDEDELNADAFENYFNPQTIYALVTNTTVGCTNIAQLTLETSSTASNNAVLEVCDDDGTEDGFYNFNLSNALDDILFGLPADLDVTFYETYEEALIEDNPLNNNFTNTTPYSQTIYARVENMNACFGISDIQLTVFELPNIVIQEEVFYCLNNFPETITLTGGLIDDIPNNYYYDWSTGEDEFEIQVNEPGIYTVRVTSTDGCFKDRAITVSPSDIATFTSIEVTDATTNNSISVFVSGDGIYEYALDDPSGPYQESNVFENVSFGFHTVYVRDIENDCGIVEELVSVIGFPKFFTPNGDTYNQHWQVKGISADFQPNSQILIFDRFGKLLKELDPLDVGWDGTFDGFNMPASDYWFVVTLEDGRTLKGHFALKR
ncbi:T9SS type B sorting domain-containing protein [Psychroserpens luteolus]|uniref:T9SS type B sorting domain-containing protein n=1 Tax=Psychroserpens luteolus TaxID=2855840 RepID=UPI001E379457|nr:T9SS type B sorting domain-containing protein [Psychroserpens luteolus]MCD2260858.1 T9SS type B sorting domain-containing protein [Psychroserpens luteolus]